MPATTPTTRLEAVNVMLSQQGEEPYSSLSGQVTAEVKIAEMILDEISREVLAMGWKFNTEYDWPLSPNSDDNIILPTDAINLRFPRHEKSQYTTRDGKVYDRTNRTFTITSTLKVDLTWLLEFTQLPEVARKYITIRAGREFAARYLASESVHTFTEQSLFEALTNLQDQEGEQQDANILDNPDIHTTVLGMRNANMGRFGAV
jgi:hypothetical protein|tara:strand:+ start:3782 stop:4393 length:612 start_codon:yes stop_codon:yes gene_type:complete